MKITIVGYSGSGKSSLARTLGNHFNINVLHLDSVHFLSNWIERDEEEEKIIVEKFLKENTSWIIDGNYSKLYFDQRMQESDIIIILLFNRFNCFFRVLNRYNKYKGKSRPDITQGCYEKLDKEFISWILYRGRNKIIRKRFYKLKLQYHHKVVIIKNQKQMNNYIRKYIVK
ncbi:MAG: AAA family ATPase [Bacilli bacterium]|jgi:adenylate kinase family enzyme